MGGCELPCASAPRCWYSVGFGKLDSTMAHLLASCAISYEVQMILTNRPLNEMIGFPNQLINFKTKLLSELLNSTNSLDFSNERIRFSNDE